MIEEGENGYLVEKADSVSLANGIEKAFEDLEKYAYMRKKSVKIYEERYTSAVYARNIENVYETL